MERLDPQLRRIIDEGMRQAQPDLRTEARMLAGLVARLPPFQGGGGDAPPGATPSAAAGSSLATLKLVVGGAIGSAVVAATIAIGSREPTTPSPDRTSVATPQRPPTVSTDAGRPAPPAASLPAIDPSAAPIAIAPAVAPPGRGPSPSAASRRPTDPHDDSIAAELALLSAAEAALDAGDDRGALALTAIHGQRHPDGQLALERDAIAAAAACGLGLPDAPRRAAAFLAAHPRAPAAAKVRARCDTATIVDAK
jgi:hypothetical protein